MPKQSKLSIWWNKAILPQQLVRDILLILLGICFSSVIQQNQVVQEFLYKYIPPDWRLPMGLIIILIIVILIFICLHKLEKKNNKTKDSVNTNIEDLIKDVDKFKELHTNLRTLHDKLDEVFSNEKNDKHT